ncbi:hypothetical protein JCM10213_001169 [Rhodosporidiobolus nylandii]
MASSPFFSRSPGANPSFPPPSTGSRTPLGSTHSAYFTANDAFSSNASAFSLAPTDHLVSASPDNAFAQSGLSTTSFGSVSTARPYPQVERRSFRDASHAGDLVSANVAPGPGAVGEGRKGSTSAMGTIGDGRRVTPSPTPGLREEEAALGLPGGIFDGHGQLAAPSAGDDGRAGSEGGRSRPSSFILDVLPQARDRGSAGPSTPSLSLDSVSPPPSSAANDYQPLPSPHSLAPSAPPTFLNPSASTSTGSLPLSPGGANVLAGSRSSSPGALESTGSLPSVESLAIKVNTLETTVTDLSTLLATEFRSLRDEVGLLRSLVLQQQQANAAGAARQAFERVQERETDSPVLTLRSPSPKHASTFPGAQPIPLGRPPYTSSTSSLLAQPATTTPVPVSSPSQGGFFGLQHVADAEARFRSTSDESSGTTSLKDEQIKLLTAQVSSLSTTVSQLLANPGVAAGNPAIAAAAAGLAAAQSPAPSPMLGGPAGGASGGMGPTAPPMAARNMSLPLAPTSLSGLGVATGLGVSTPTGMLSPSLGAGPPGQGGRSPMMRTASTPGLVRSASMRSASGGPGTFESLPSDSAWNGGMSSPMLGGPAPAVSSPMLGNPPGSLGSKWEVLGVGQDLFRAVAKYGLGPPTKIQGKAIPCVVRGQDVVAQAPAIQERIQCYVIPALQIIFTHASLAAQQAALEGSTPAPRGIQAVVVTATVDQAAQAQRLAVGLGGSLGIRTSLCVGQGGDIQSELQTLLKAPPQILVGTPQKLLDLFSQRSLPMNDIRLLIIDECDQLIARNLSDFVLNLARLFPPTTTVPTAVNSSPVMARSPVPGAFDSPSFTSMARFGSSNGAPAPSNGAGATPQAIERQMAVFSCTVPQDVLNFASSLQLKEPVKVLVRRENTEGGGGSSGGASSSLRGVKQYYLYLAMGGNPGAKNKAIGAGRREAGPAREWKLEALADLVEDSAVDRAVVFTASMEAVEAVSYKLGMRAIEALALHQDIGQAGRQQIIAKFRSTAPSRPGLSSKRVLVVHDQLARSLVNDIHQSVPLVINFDMNRSPEDYGPRLACCAPPQGYGKHSMVINIVTPNEVDAIRGIEAFYRCKISELPPNFASTSSS